MESYETIKVLFAETIKETDKMFDDVEIWGVSTIKEWIDHFESTRFTQIGEHTAIITSEYNMYHVKNWLQRYFPNANIQKL
jgi:hypothetical protein